MASSSGRIVVGLDGSPGGRAALTFALHEAARRGATAEVVTAFDSAETLAALCGTTVTSVGRTTAELRDAVRDEASVVVMEVSTEAMRSLDRLPPVTVTAVGGHVVRVLLHAAKDADLLVVGSHGRGGFASVLLGSVSVQCVLHASCPVTVVHVSHDHHPAVPAPAVPA